MADVAELVRRIRSGPQGPQVGAFFDFGGTLVHGFDRLMIGGRGPGGVLRAGIRGPKTDADVEDFLDRARRHWRCRDEAELKRLGDRLFTHTVAGRLYPEAWPLIRAHEAAGHTLVLVSSASKFQVAPAAAELGIPHILSTQMEVYPGKSPSGSPMLTGEVAGSVVWRSGKVDAVRRFAEDAGLDLTAGYAYADVEADEPFLSLVTHPTAVNPDHGLATAAGEHGWPTVRFRPRPDAGPALLARTAAGLTALVAGAAAGAVAHSRGRDRRRMVNGLLAWGTNATLRTLGVRVRVTGREKVDPARPAVFAFNHQSNFDIVVMAHVLRHDATGVAKKEVVHNPIFGPIFRFIGATFVDRANTEAAIAALQPCIDTLHTGISIAIAPEGHRSVSPRLLPFKKGAFHLAIQAGVPLVPVVIRNSGEVMWRNATAVRPGTVDVAVLDPIDVGDWDPDNLDDRVEQVRALFAATLADWPG